MEITTLRVDWISDLDITILRILLSFPFHFFKNYSSFETLYQTQLDHPVFHPADTAGRHRY